MSFLIFLLISAACLSIIFFLINAADVEPTIEKTYIFNKEFDEKLISLGCKTQFLRNLNKDCVNKGEIPSRRINLLKKEKNWMIFIMSSFMFNETPEGFKYWSEIAKS